MTSSAGSNDWREWVAPANAQMDASFQTSLYNAMQQNSLNAYQQQAVAQYQMANVQMTPNEFASYLNAHAPDPPKVQAHTAVITRCGFGGGRRPRSGFPGRTVAA